MTNNKTRGWKDGMMGGGGGVRGGGGFCYLGGLGAFEARSLFSSRLGCWPLVSRILTGQVGLALPRRLFI